MRFMRAGQSGGAMQNLPLSTPPLLPPAAPTAPTKTDRRNRATLKLLFIAALVLLLQWPLHLVNALQQERRETREINRHFRDNMRLWRTTGKDDA